MNDEKMFNETIYVIRMIKSLLNIAEYEKLKEKNISVSTLPEEKRIKLAPAIFDRNMLNYTSNDYIEMLQEYSKTYIKKVNNYYKTEFNTLNDCLIFVGNKMKERSGKRGFY